MPTAAGHTCIICGRELAHLKTWGSDRQHLGHSPGFSCCCCCALAATARLQFALLAGCLLAFTLCCPSDKGLGRLDACCVRPVGVMVSSLQPTRSHGVAQGRGRTHTLQVRMLPLQTHTCERCIQCAVPKAGYVSHCNTFVDQCALCGRARHEF